jgi:hypothetical protein
VSCSSAASARGWFAKASSSPFPRNPTIFEQAIAHGDPHDTRWCELLERRLSAKELSRAAERDTVNAAFRAAAQESSLVGLLGFAEELVGSSDIVARLTGAFATAG